MFARLDLITITAGAAKTASDLVGAAPGQRGKAGNGAGIGAGAGASSKSSGGRPMIFITARVHPGESPAQYVCQVRLGAAARSACVARPNVCLYAL